MVPGVCRGPCLGRTGCVRETTPERRNAQRRSEARQKLGIRQDALLLGSTGAISMRKNQIDMIRVLKRLVASGVDTELLLIGGFSAKKEAMPGWREALCDPAVAGRVHLAGPRADAVELAAAMDIFLFTSVVEEAPIRAHIVLDEFSSGSTAKRLLVGFGSGRSTVEGKPG